MDPADPPTDYAALRRAMIEQQLRPTGISEATLAAVARVPRELFVPPDERRDAYADSPLPIGHGQTISQPFMVAAMTELLRLRPGARVLEIGAGSGYQTAVLCELGAEVVAIERLPELVEAARPRLAALGHEVDLRCGDGAAGAPDKAPYDAILVACATPTVPPALVAQLGPEGRLVLPVGEVGTPQTLTVITRNDEGRPVSEAAMAVRFVPFVSRELGTDPQA